ncbi:histidine kinase-, DNA gyrase B-, and HSP90-like ATPase family protein [Tanacetum coccineum]
MYGQPPPPLTYLTSQPPSYLDHPTYLHNLYYHHHQPPPPPNPNLSSGEDVMERNMFIMKIGKAVTNARRGIVSSGEHVSSAKVVEDVVLELDVDGWDSLGVNLGDVPPLFRLMQLEKKINTFINCFVEVWEIITLYDLETAICKNEGVSQYEELELGPLIRHPLVIRYFHVSSDSTGVFKISGEEIVNYLIEFMDTHKGIKVGVENLLDFIAKKRAVDSKEKLHVRIQSLRLHLSFINQARPLEISTLNKCFLSKKEHVKESSSGIPECIKPVFSGNGDGDDIKTNHNTEETCLTNQNKTSSPNMEGSGRVSNCPNYSETQENIPLGVLNEKKRSPSPDRLKKRAKKRAKKSIPVSSPSLDRLNCNESTQKSTKKRKLDLIDCTSSASCNSPKKDGVGQGFNGNPSTTDDVALKKFKVADAIGSTKEEESINVVLHEFVREHRGVGYLNKDTVLTDSLARALGIEECGPKVLVQVLTSLCRSGSLKLMGLSWLSSWLNKLFLMLVNGAHHDVLSSLRQLSFIPLLDGIYASKNEGAIWMDMDEHGFKTFGKLYSKLRIVNPALFNDHSENITRMLYKVGVQSLSAHEIIKGHILPAICDENIMLESTELIIEYLSYIMFYLESSVRSQCLVEKEHILSQLREKAYIYTNHGHKRLADVPIHFGKIFGNPFDMSKLVSGTGMKWFEIDISYLKHPVCQSLSKGSQKWRKFLRKLGVSDFVKMVEVKKGVWDSQELTHLLSHISSKGDKEKSKYLLKVLNNLWDSNFGNKPFTSYVIKILNGVQWLVSDKDTQLHFPKDLFHDCELVREVVNDRAPYVVPKVKTMCGFVTPISGLEPITITLDADLSIILFVFRRHDLNHFPEPGTYYFTNSSFPCVQSFSFSFSFYIVSHSPPALAPLVQLLTTTSLRPSETFANLAFIFIPHSHASTNEVVVGLFLSPNEVYWQWHDPIVSLMEQTNSPDSQSDQSMTHRSLSNRLCDVYPGLHDFFVNELGVAENPPLRIHLPSLIQCLSTGSLPSQAVKTVFQVFQKWSAELDSGVLSSDDIDYLKKCMEGKEVKILPTMQDKWVSLHQSFGLVCWCDDEQLGNQYKNLNNVHFISFGELTTQETHMFQDKISVLFRILGISSLSEIVTREAVYYGQTDNNSKASLINLVLPYAQRYIYSVHPDVYDVLKCSWGLKHPSCLRVVEVKKLAYINVIKKCGIKSNKRIKSNCLLQDGILYTINESDTHSLFRELSRFLLAGFPELPLANFLQMIITMTQSSSLVDKMEIFISDNQKLLNLPCEDSQWSLAYGSAQMSHGVTERLIKTDGDWIVKGNPASTSTIPSVILEEDEASKEVFDSVIDMNAGFKGQLDDGKNISPLSLKHAITGETRGTGERNGETGRTGELVAFKYFSAKLGEDCVKWVNEIKESGLPYDIVIEGSDNSKEYIEVKATSHAWKDWFRISVKEWDFAREKVKATSPSAGSSAAKAVKKGTNKTHFKKSSRQCRLLKMVSGRKLLMWLAMRGRRTSG